ncbi:hypothetical protein DFQ27_002419 [Actinomortierella ambigua]|uniref:UVR domain-containing protein n=1 Tax=Actinomortierella ambigua TaxID=1343610 RepID=A0A9P6QC24_9FUNG|nr:hypothetical protein DFQ27_002419 [Actinomortierella ambigua]
MSSVSRRYREYQGSGDGDEDSGERSGAGFRTSYEDDEDEDLMNPRATLLKEDASPPLQWGGMGLQHHAATDQEELSSSRFGIDDIAGGAFAVPMDPRERPPSVFNIASTTTLEPLSSSGRSLSKLPSSAASSISVSSPPSILATTSASKNSADPPKRRKWQPPSKTQGESATTSIASTLFSTSLLDDEDHDQKQHSGLISGDEAPSAPVPAVTTERSKEGDDPAANGATGDVAIPRKSTSPPPTTSSSAASSSQSAFSFETLSISRKGIASGLASLKNSIMIPSVHQQQSPVSPSTGVAAVTGSATMQRTYDHEDGARPMLTHSQSNLLDQVVHATNDTYAETLFDTHHHPSRAHEHHRHYGGGRTTKSESTTPRVIDADLGAGSSKRHGGGRWGSNSSSSSTSVQAKWSQEMSGAGIGSPRGYHSLQSSRTLSHWTSPSSSTVLLPPTTAGGHDGGSGRSRRPHRGGGGEASSSALQAGSQHLAAVEGEFQRLMQHQSQLLMRKADLDKELLSLYSRRNQCEVKQGQAAAQEQYEEAEGLRVRARAIAERIETVEPLLAETERRLWAVGQRQLELGKSVAQSQLQLIQEMQRSQQHRRAKMRQVQEREVRRHLEEVGRIAAEREKVEQERSEIALSADFLGKNEQELKSRMEDETKTEQEQLQEVLDARSQIKNEIEELQQRLTQLRTKDVELDGDESRLRQKIHKMTAHFDERAKEVRQERAHLDDRISDLNHKAQKLDHAETEIQAWKQRSQRAQDDMEHEIQSLQEQQMRLTSVHTHFEQEMESIKALFAEEETFRELKARWAMRASSLVEDLAKHEQLCQTLATKLLEEQKQINILEQGIERLETQIPKLESSKTLAVQQRDFKQAAWYAKEISITTEAIQSKRAELDERRKAEDEQEQSRLTQLNKDYERQKAFVQEEESKLAKEIEDELKSLSEQLVAKEESMISLATQSIGSIKDEDKTLATPPTSATTDEADKGHDAKELVSATNAPSENPQLLLFKSLFKEKLSDLEMMRELAKVRFGRQEPRLQSSTSSTLVGVVDTKLREDDSAQPAADAKSDTNDLGKEEENNKKQEEGHRIERDIQAAIAEEDYEKAAELQAQLDSLRGAA